MRKAWLLPVELFVVYFGEAGVSHQPEVSGSRRWLTPSLSFGSLRGAHGAELWTTAWSSYV